MLKSLGSSIVWLSITKPTSTVTFLSDDGTGAFARFETAATAGAIGVALACASDELGALLGWLGLCALLGRLSFGSLLLLAALFLLAALLLLVTLFLLDTLLLLTALLGCSSLGVPIRDPIALATRENSVLSLNSLRSDIVRLLIAVSASAISLLGDDGAGAFARVETTTFRGAVGIGFAGAGDELGAWGCAGDVGRCDGESEVKDDKGTDG